jgi:hypothetical protein
MKNIRTYISLSIIVQLLFTGLHAQKIEGDPAARANKITEWMKTNLQLDDNQVPLVRSINLECARKIQGLQSSSQTGKQKMIVVRANEQNRDDALRTVLTEDQFNTWQTKKRQFKIKWQETIREKDTD